MKKYKGELTMAPHVCITAQPETHWDTVYTRVFEVIS